jgi:predicted short-subunit dehydrogenase-like oxidoreductase (DUF2520 family)
MSDSTQPKICIIGMGRVGLVLAFHLSQANVTFSSLIDKNAIQRSNIRQYMGNMPIHKNLTPSIINDSQIFLICVQDDNLVKIIENFVSGDSEIEGKIFVHTSGAYSSEIMGSVQEKGALIASAHPIFSFSTAPPSKQMMNGVYFDIEGDEEAIAFIIPLLKQLGCIPIRLSKGQKLAVHLASVFYSNYLVGLADVAQKILQGAGLANQDLFKPFLPLIHSTLNHLVDSPPSEALTGPLKRGDLLTLKSHLNYLKKNYPEGLQAYFDLSNILLKTAKISKKDFSLITNLFSEYIEH